MQIWYEWYKSKTGITPKINGSQGLAIKEIVKYFESTYPEYTPQKCLQTLLNNWDRLSPFNQKFKEIRSINSQLTNLLEDLKNGKSTKQTAIISDIDRMAAETLREIQGSTGEWFPRVDDGHEPDAFYFGKYRRK